MRRLLILSLSLSLSLLLGAGLAACGSNAGNDGGNNGNGDGGGGGDGDGGTGGPDSGGDPEFQTCKKIDIVIAVDNSGSMAEEKSALANDVFPTLATQLLAIGGGLEDYRVGVLDACPNPANYHTGGVGGPCNFSSGQVWMLSSDTDLPGEFQCVGDIDSSDSLCSGDNDDEQPATAATASMEDPWRTGANAGFLRDDAVLVVMAITDEDEQPTPDVSAQAVYDRLVAVKGDVKKMVFLGVAGGSACTGVYGSATEAVKMKQIVDLFVAQERGVFWDLCNGRLEDGLTQALMVIAQACEEFPPIP